MTTSQMINAEVDSKLRRDGLPLVWFNLTWNNGTGGWDFAAPNDAGRFRREIIMNGGTIHDEVRSENGSCPAA